MAPNFTAIFEGRDDEVTPIRDIGFLSILRPIEEHSAKNLGHFE